MSSALRKATTQKYGRAIIKKAFTFMTFYCSYLAVIEI